jgi:hypothetical protein
VTLRTRAYTSEQDQALAEAVERRHGDTTLLDLMKRDARFVALLRRWHPERELRPEPLRRTA